MGFLRAKFTANGLLQNAVDNKDHARLLAVSNKGTWCLASGITLPIPSLGLILSMRIAMGLRRLQLGGKACRNKTPAQNVTESCMPVMRAYHFMSLAIECVSMGAFDPPLL